MHDAEALRPPPAARAATSSGKGGAMLATAPTPAVRTLTGDESAATRYERERPDRGGVRRAHRPRGPTRTTTCRLNPGRAVPVHERRRGSRVPALRQAADLRPHIVRPIDQTPRRQARPRQPLRDRGTPTPVLDHRTLTAEVSFPTMIRSAKRCARADERRCPRVAPSHGSPVAVRVCPMTRGLRIAMIRGGKSMPRRCANTPGPDTEEVLPCR